MIYLQVYRSLEKENGRFLHSVTHMSVFLVPRSSFANAHAEDMERVGGGDLSTLSVDK